MKKMKPKSTQPCSYCKLRAKWKANGLIFPKFACETHVTELRNFELAHEDNGYMSEADYQTWGRL